MQRHLAPVVEQKLPRGTGVVLTVLIIGGGLGFGVVRGGHGPAIADELAMWRDGLANAAGFGIRSVTLAGNHQVTREEILATAGVTGHSSLLFLDVDTARERLRNNPWIADATVLKLYPGALKISVTERKAFALWQKDRRVSVIAADGAVLEPYVARRFTSLPLVVGVGADQRAEPFLAMVDRFPTVAGQLRAAVLVAQRRWNIRLKNGIDVRLPEHGVDQALAILSRLDAEKKLLSRDITAVDLRLPDRVTVRLSDDAAAARAEAIKKSGRHGDSV